MRKVIFISLAIFPTLLLQSCQYQISEQESSTNIVDTIQILDRTENFQDHNFESKITYPVLSGMSDLIFQEEVNSSIVFFADSVKNDLENEAKLFYNESESAYPFNLDIGFSVKCNQNGIVSLLLEVYQYSGGAHGTTDYVPVNIDIQDNFLLKLNDLFVEKSDYISPIHHFVSDSIKEVPESFFTSSLVINKTDIQNSFYITHNHLVFFFPLYDLAPYSSGIPEFSIPFKNFSSIFSNNYKDRLK